MAGPLQSGVPSPPTWVGQSASLARCQRSLGDPRHTFDLYPALSAGCPRISTDDVAYPVEIGFDYDELDPAIFDQAPLPGLDRWAALLPPLMPGLSMGEGGTALVPSPGLAACAGVTSSVYVKDESGNPTWSHKDRFNLCTVSTAAAQGARGIAVASTGNHGASAAAYAARAGLPCVVVVAGTTDERFRTFIEAYGACVVSVGMAERMGVVRHLARHHELHPVGNLTDAGHTGHPFGPEGYKTIAYEIFAAPGGRVPETIIVPTGYGELLFGIYKGFRELREFDRIERLPRLVAVEPENLGPLRAAVDAGLPVARVPAGPSVATGIAAAVSSYRGVVALRETAGLAIGVDDGEIAAASEIMSRSGHWQEMSGAASLAALIKLKRLDGEPGTTVLLATSSGLKEPARDRRPVADPGDRMATIDRLVEAYLQAGPR